jgi:hypothetical protein
MVSGRRAVFGSLFFFWLACSTEDTGLGNVNDGAEPSSVQSEDVGAPPDLRVNRPDRGIDPAPDAPGADAPGVSDGGTDAPIDSALPPSDVAPDLAAPIDQPMGAACGANGECKGGHCVDGFCCESLCNDGCNACSQARTGRANGVCSWAKDTDGNACGKTCGSVAAVPSVVQKICRAGACVVPAAPKVLESCRDDNPCVAAFCDNNEARCVKTTCPTAGTCCCRATTGDRMCLKQDQCKGKSVCE